MSALASATTHTIIERSGVVVRHARVADAPAITRLIGAWADRGLTIRRSLGDVLSSIGDFSVAVLPGASGAGDGQVVACASLEVFSGGGLDGTPEAEVRSVSVAIGHEGCGAGRAVVARLLEEARARGVERVVLLTRSRAFFERCGFEVIEPEALSSAYVQRQVVGRGRTLQGRTAMRWQG